MGLKTKEEYIESIRALKPTAYMFGERITNVVDNPRIRAGIESTAATYEMAMKEENKELFITVSPLINEPVSRFTLYSIKRDKPTLR
jgi:4-hydroxybutyryl-CoA dehydratase/vinylacetyl-CoA-Delta-isomerase